MSLALDDAFEVYVWSEKHPLHKRCILCIPITGYNRAMYHIIRARNSLLHQDNLSGNSRFTMGTVLEILNFLLGGRSFPPFAPGHQVRFDDDPNLSIYKYKTYEWNDFKNHFTGQPLADDDLNHPLEVRKVCINLPSGRGAEHIDDNFCDIYRAVFSTTDKKLEVKLEGGLRNGGDPNFPDNVLDAYKEFGRKCSISGGEYTECAHIIDLKYGPALYQMLADVTASTSARIQELLAHQQIEIPYQSPLTVADFRCALRSDVPPQDTDYVDSYTYNHFTNGFFLSRDFHHSFDRLCWISVGSTAIWLAEEIERHWLAAVCFYKLEGSETERNNRLLLPSTQIELPWFGRPERAVVGSRTAPFLIKTAIALMSHYCPAYTRLRMRRYIQSEQDCSDGEEAEAEDTSSKPKRQKEIRPHVSTKRKRTKVGGQSYRRKSSPPSESDHEDVEDTKKVDDETVFGAELLLFMLAQHRWVAKAPGYTQHDLEALAALGRADL